jgi:hypothetical protein
LHSTTAPTIRHRPSLSLVSMPLLARSIPLAFLGQRA